MIMKIYTSNFSRTQNIPHYSISLSKPEWDNSIGVIRELQPDPMLLKMWNSLKHLGPTNPKVMTAMRVYSDSYKDHLKTIDVMSLLEDGMVLCCWCGKGKFCHRVVLAEYLREKGVIVEEL